MAKSIKLKDNNYIDSTGVVHNRTLLSDILSNMLNSVFTNIVLSSFGVTDTANEITVGTYTIPSSGVYLITGICHPNYYGESGRDLFTYLKKNGDIVWYHDAVINTYAWTISRGISCIINANKNDVITFTIQNSVAGKKYSFAGGNIQFYKLK